MRWKPLLLMAGRILAGALLIGLGMALVRLALIPGLERLFVMDEAVVSVLRRVCMLMSFAGSFWLYLHFIVKRPASPLALRPVPLLIWGGLGSALIALSMLGMLITGAYEVSGIRPLGPMANVALTLLAAAAFEEILFRGVIVPAVEEALGAYTALIAPSLLFSVLHFFNPNWAGWVSLATGLLLGVLWTLVYLITRNVWAATLNHALWNFTIVLSGLPLTGIEEWRDIAPLQSRYQGPDWLSGGAAGPEESVITLAVSVLAVIGLWLYWLKTRSRPEL
ncbi:lysostaphin resistance A-like protein [Oceanicaulis sp. LC35]|uniref:CPBP family intramembrane glutamic endopeptidase n=1 Tax=Oceanicaulis sp. LC35 TaxID=3349635 RepID=UPI003F86842B